MNITEQARKNYEKAFQEKNSLEIEETDCDFSERLVNFAFDEVACHGNISENIRYMIILSALLGCNGNGLFIKMVPAALNCGVTPVQIKEIIYQATAYVGIGISFEALRAVNDIFSQKGIDLPDESRANTTMKDRLEKGNQIQIRFFGEEIRESWKCSDPAVSHINYWLADNCFGDYYTRSGLTDRQREMITFCFISALGGCEPQLIAHAKANMRVGNSKSFLIEVVSQSIPYIGYPRSLNAIAAINKACE